MTRPVSLRRSRSRLQWASLQIVLLGALFLLLPRLLESTAVGRAAGPLGSIGWWLVTGGAVLCLLASCGSAVMRSKARSNPPPSTSPEPPRPTTWGPGVLNAIEWRRLEALVEALFRQAGFETRSQSHGADGGVDVWLHAPGAPAKPLGVIQCKHHHTPVGVDKVRELRGVMAAHGVSRGQFVSTAGFTADARGFGRENGIHLLDGAALLALIGRRTAEQQAELLAVATEGEFWRPTCARCGVKMVERNRRSDGREIWGCVNFPQCTSQVGAAKPVRSRIAP